MVLPVGTPDAQMLIGVEKRHGEVIRRKITSCVFVPLLGAFGWPTD